MKLMTAVGVLGVMLLAGCSARVTPPKVEIETAPPVEVKIGGGHDSDGFCPPGQRKKGNC